MAQRPDLRIVTNDAASSTGTFQPVGIQHPDGTEYFRGKQPPPVPPSNPNDSDGGDGHGGGLGARVSTLEHRTGRLEGMLAATFGLGLLGFIGLCLGLSGKIEGRFDILDGRIRDLANVVSTTNTDNARNFGQILARLPDDQSQRSPRAEPTQPVRQGTGGRAGRSGHP